MKVVQKNIGDPLGIFGRTIDLIVPYGSDFDFIISLLNFREKVFRGDISFNDLVHYHSKSHSLSFISQESQVEGLGKNKRYNPPWKKV